MHRPLAERRRVANSFDAVCAPGQAAIEKGESVILLMIGRKRLKPEDSLRK
jgi:hypothetical protein